jgi:hypothetical protein
MLFSKPFSNLKQFDIDKYVHISVYKISSNFNMQGVANRGCSIRVGRETEQKGKGTTTILL